MSKSLEKHSETSRDFLTCPCFNCIFNKINTEWGQRKEKCYFYLYEDSNESCALDFFDSFIQFLMA